MDTQQIITCCSVAIAVGSFLFAIKKHKEDRKFAEKKHNEDNNQKLLEIYTRELAGALATPGIKDFLKLFEGRQPEKFAAILDQGFSALNQLSAIEARNGSVLRAIASTKLDEPTFRIHERIESNDKLFSRFQQFKSSKTFLRRRILGNPIIHEVIMEHECIFIESGSTLSYVALGIIDAVHELRPDRRNRPLKVCTNSILVYILLLFEPHIRAVLLPGDPTNPYGATFGKPGSNESCDPTAVRKFLEENKVTAMFTTASVLDIKYGPHVGSSPNQQIKDIFVEYGREHTSCLNFFVIAAEKINNLVAETGLGNACNLVFAPPHETISTEIQNSAEAGWRDFMSRPTNYIITGSQSREIVHKVYEQLSLPGHHAHIQQCEDGDILCVRGGRVAERPVKYSPKETIRSESPNVASGPGRV